MAVRPCGKRKADSQLATLPNPAHPVGIAGQTPPHPCRSSGLWESYARAISMSRGPISSTTPPRNPGLGTFEHIIRGLTIFALARAKIRDIPVQ